MNIIGIDPGQSGGIASIEHVMGAMMLPVAWKMPDTERDTYKLLEMAHDPLVGTFAYIEQVHSMPGQGVKGVFSFGQNYGMLRAFLIALGIPFETVTPQKWQKAMGCLSKRGMSKTQHKNQLKAKSQELFPQLTITHAIADCLLIAEYGRRLKGER